MRFPPGGHAPWSGERPGPMTSEDRAGGVRRGVGVAGHDLLHASYDGPGLRARGAGELDRLAHQGGDVGPVEPETRVRGETVEEVVVRAALAHLEGDRDRVLLDRLVGGLAADAGADRGDQH